MHFVRRTGRAWIAAAFTLGVLACSPEAVEETPTPTKPTASIQAMRASLGSLEGEWVLTNYKNDPLEPAQQNRATLTMSKEVNGSLRITGRSFVNYYGGTFTVDEQKGLLIAAGNLLSTLIGGSEADNRAEITYLDRLAKATYFEITGTNQLQLYVGPKDAASTEVLYFTRK